MILQPELRTRHQGCRSHLRLPTPGRAAWPGTAAVQDERLEAQLGWFRRVRREGGGRHSVDVAQPGLLAALDELVHPYTRGDPESPLRWTTKSTSKLAAELAARGFKCTAPTVGKLLRKLGYSLQAPAKVLEGTAHPDRDQQFQHIATQSSLFLTMGQPSYLG